MKQKFLLYLIPLEAFEKFLPLTQLVSDSRGYEHINFKY